MKPLRLPVALVAALLCLLVAPSAHAVTPGVALGAGPGIDESGRAAAALRSQSARVFMSWDEFEPSPGQLREDVAGRFDQYCRNFQDLLIVVLDAPSWAAGVDSSTTVQPPKDLAAFSSFMTRVGNRLPCVDHWEIWNEPDGQGFWGGRKAAPGEYAEVLKAGARGVRATGQGDTVVAGALVAGGALYDYVNAYYDAGAQDLFDAVAVHYDTACRTASPDAFDRITAATPGFTEDGLSRYEGWIHPSSFSSFKELHRITAARGAEKSIWVTELGWNTRDGGNASRCIENNRDQDASVSPAEQADFLTKAYQCLQANSIVGRGYWFSLFDVTSPGLSAQSYDAHLGLLYADGRRKPAADAFQAFASAPSARQCGGVSDAVKPTIDVRYPLQGEEVANRVRILVRGADAETRVGKIEYEIPALGAKLGNGSLPVAQRSTYDTDKLVKRLKPGKHRVILRVYDEALNVTQVERTIVKLRPGQKPKGIYDVQPALEVKKLKASAKERRAKRSPVQVAIRLAWTAPSEAGSPVGRVRYQFEKQQGRKWVKRSKASVKITAKTGTRVKQLRVPLFGKGKWRVTARFENQSPFKTFKVRSKPFRT